LRRTCSSLQNSVSLLVWPSTDLAILPPPQSGMSWPTLKQKEGCTKAIGFGKLLLVVDSNATVLCGRPFGPYNPSHRNHLGHTVFLSTQWRFQRCANSTEHIKNLRNCCVFHKFVATVCWNWKDLIQPLYRKLGIRLQNHNLVQ
jgi:hypothetical protein